jgi:hypothetical protein
MFELNRVVVRASNNAMKTVPPSLPFLAIITALNLGLSLSPAHAQAPAEAQKDAKPVEAVKKTDDTTKAAAAAQKPLPTDPEERFKLLFNRSYLSGRWAPLRDGVLGEERGGDKYHIVSVVKGEGDNWIISAKMKYGEREFVMPIPVKMQFTGDVAILTVDNLAIPGGGTYTARLLIYERTYSGTWKGQRGGGMLYGTITSGTE